MSATPAPPLSAQFLALDVDKLDAWKRDHFQANGATLIVSGAFDVPKMKREIDELFGPWPETERALLPEIAKPHPAAGPDQPLRRRDRAT